MRVEQLSAEQLAEAVQLVARRQGNPATHVAYLSASPQAITAELSALDPDGLAGVLVARDPEGTIVGLLGAEHDHDPPRVWWMGPYVADCAATDDVADRLYDRARSRLPAYVGQEELACDDRSQFLALFAQRHGFVAEEASVLLSRALGSGFDGGTTDDSVTVRAPSPSQRLAAARLHDALFPGSHSTGRHALRGEPGRVAVVAVSAGAVLGYAVAEAQADGSGYVDFVGVTEVARGRGIGGALVTQVCRALHSRHRCPTAHLTVRASNAAARRLYARLGFVEERLLRPWRRGFSLSH